MINSQKTYVGFGYGLCEKRLHQYRGTILEGNSSAVRAWLGGRLRDSQRRDTVTLGEQALP